LTKTNSANLIIIFSDEDDDGVSKAIKRRVISYNNGDDEDDDDDEDDGGGRSKTTIRVVLDVDYYQRQARRDARRTAENPDYELDAATMSVRYRWRVPWDLAGGNYRLEVGVKRGQSALYARSPLFSVAGGLSDCVFCVCGDVQHEPNAARARSYVKCIRCLSWSHQMCYKRNEDDQTDFGWSTRRICQICGSLTLKNDLSST
jgi:hypothetical protein